MLKNRIRLNMALEEKRREEKKKKKKIREEGRRKEKRKAKVWNVWNFCMKYLVGIV